MKSLKSGNSSVSTLIVAIGLCVAAMGFINMAGAADWPNYRGPDYNGFTKETDWKSNWGDSGPKVLWEKSIGMGFSSMAVADGRGVIHVGQQRRSRYGSGYRCSMVSNDDVAVLVVY